MMDCCGPQHLELCSCSLEARICQNLKQLILLMIAPATSPLSMSYCHSNYCSKSHLWNMYSSHNQCLAVTIVLNVFDCVFNIQFKYEQMNNLIVRFFITSYVFIHVWCLKNNTRNAGMIIYLTNNMISHPKRVYFSS